VSPPRTRSHVRGKPYQPLPLAALEEIVGLVAAAIDGTFETQRGTQFDTPRAAESGDQVGMLGAESGDDASRRADVQDVAFLLDNGMQCDQSPQHRRAEQAATGLQVGFPLDEDLAPPEPSIRQLVVASQVSRQVGVCIGQGRLDTGQACLDVH
jgi:hypothetical protein